jgi:hypothetical protein
MGKMERRTLQVVMDESFWKLFDQYNANIQMKLAERKWTGAAKGRVIGAILSHYFLEHSVLSETPTSSQSTSHRAPGLFDVEALTETRR